MSELKLRQIRSSNGASPAQRDTLRSLRLGRIGRESTMTETPQLDGMLRVVSHLVSVEKDGKG